MATGATPVLRLELMNEMQPVERPKKPRGNSIWTYLIICLVLAVVGMGALGYALYHSNSDRIRLAGQLEAQQNETKRHELATLKATEDGQLTLAGTQQEHLLAQVTAASNSLVLLLDGSAALRGEAAALGVTVQNATIWADQGLLKLGQVRDALSGLVRESKIKFTQIGRAHV